MAVEKLIVYSGAALDPAADLEKTEDETRIALRPRDESGNHVVALAHFEDTNIDSANRIIGGFSESAYGGRFDCYRARWESGQVMLGSGSMYLDTTYGFVRLPHGPRHNNLSDFTVDIFARFGNVTGVKYCVSEFFQIDSSHRARWLLGRYGTELMARTYDEGGNEATLMTSGLGLLVDTWYHVRFSYHGAGNGTSEAKLSLDGSQVAYSDTQKLLPALDESIRPFITVGGYLYHPSNYYQGGQEGYYDEFILYPSVLPSNFTVRTQALKPFSQSGPRATLTLDAGFDDAVWDSSSICFFDEADFDNSGIKMRRDADNDDTPAFSGGPMTLSQFKGGDDPAGRYLHIEFTFYSDGDTGRTLFPGKIILCTGKPSIIARREPEIVRR